MQWQIIIDANSFYASVEKVFRPELRNAAVAVLSNNDGIIVALSSEAKELGFKRGDAVHLIKKEIKQKKLHLFSSNYILYYDFSRRIEQIVSRTFVNVQKYSIDEMFVTYKSAKSVEHLRTLLKKVKDEVLQETKIHVSIGAASTKTLSKVMNQYAKKDKRYKGVAILPNNELLQRALDKFPVENVWGIGRRGTKKLASYNIHTAWQFSQQHDSWIRKYFSITGLRTAKELRGVNAVTIADFLQDKKSIMCSRSFGQAVSKFQDLKAALADFVEEAAEKLRKQQSVCKTVSVFVSSYPPKGEKYGYQKSIQLELPYFASDTIHITTIAFLGLERIFKTGERYKKAGVVLGEFISENNLQYSLWDDIDKIQKYRKLYQKVDFINSSDGRIYLAVQNTNDAKHAVRLNHKSPQYTTNIAEVLKIDMG